MMRHLYRKKGRGKSTNRGPETRAGKVDVKNWKKASVVWREWGAEVDSEVKEAYRGQIRSCGAWKFREKSLNCILIVIKSLKGCSRLESRDKCPWSGLHPCWLHKERACPRMEPILKMLNREMEREKSGPGSHCLSPGWSFAWIRNSKLPYD